MRKTRAPWAWWGAVAMALAVTALVVVPTDMSAQKTDQAEALLQAARAKQVVEGKLDDAVAIYRDVLARHGTNRPVAARALVGLGQCYEKLGAAQTTEARKVYERIVAQYGDQQDAAAHARARLAALATTRGAGGVATLTVRRVWADADVTGQVSADGRFVTFTDWFAGGNLAIHDLATGQNRLLTTEGRYLQGGPASYSAFSAPSPDGQSVAYGWRHANGQYDLRVIGSDGSRPRLLRSAGEGIVRAQVLAWSPDGRHLLYEFRKADGSRDILLVAVDDGSTKVLKTFRKDDRQTAGAFSPDGRYVASATQEGLSVIDLPTGTENPIVPDRSNRGILGWAPDGRHILFSSERSGSSDAWLIAVAGGKAQGEPVFVKKDWGFLPMGFSRSGAFYYAVNNNVANVQIAELDPASGKLVSPPQFVSQQGNTRGPDWSPDGRSLAYLVSRDKYHAVIVRSMDTGDERELQVAGRTVGPGNLRWTRDGTAVVVPTSEPGKGENLVRLDVRTGQMTPLMPLPSVTGLPRFEFSPDGTLALCVRPPAAPDANGNRLVARDLRSGQETEIIARRGLFAVALSPDGQRVVIAVSESGSQTLLVMPAGGGEAHELVRVDGAKEVPFQGSPSWTPDGRYVVFLKGVKGVAPKQWELWRVAAEGGDPQRLGLTVARQYADLRLHPDGRRVAISDFRVDLEVWVMENFLPKPEAASAGKTK